MHFKTKNSCGTATWFGVGRRNQSNWFLSVLTFPVVLSRAVSQWKDTVGLVGPAAAGYLQNISAAPVSPEALMDLE